MAVQEVNLDRWNNAAPLLTRQDILQIVPINASTLWRWCCAGKFPQPVPTMGRVFWKREDIERWMDGEL